MAVLVRIHLVTRIRLFCSIYIFEVKGFNVKTRAVLCDALFAVNVGHILACTFHMEAISHI